jgi:hypothetical protein
MARKIIKKSERHVYEDLAHHALESFIKHDRAEELVEKKQAMQFLSGIMWRNWYSSTSPWHKLYRKSGKEEELYPDVIGAGGRELWINKSHTENVWSKHDEEPYDMEWDLKIESIQGIMEDMEADTVEQWFRVTLFKMWLDQPNYSELSRMTGIPRTSISQAVSECKDYIKQTIEIWN